MNQEFFGFKGGKKYIPSRASGEMWERCREVMKSAELTGANTKLWERVGRQKWANYFHIIWKMHHF